VSVSGGGANHALSGGGPSDSPSAPDLITAVVLTLNEARHLPDCLAGLRGIGPILVLDSGSDDETQAIARAAGARVVARPFVNYSIQRQAALDLVDTPWVLFVDADERVPPELAAAVTQATLRADADAPAAYWIARRNLFWGHALRGGGWWPDHQLRLLRVDRAHYDPARAVHELAEIQGSTGRIDSPFTHINYESWAEFIAKQRTYARLEAGRRRAAGARVRPHNLILQPLREFQRRFVTNHGYRDGLLGLRLALAMAWTEWVTLWGTRRNPLV
jgi:glycosyltransferase involved in cell wall biosynthesis